MTSQIRILVKHVDLPDAEGATTVATLVDAGALATADADAFLNAVLDAVEQGRKNVAGGYLVDYDSFRSDSSYLDRIDEVVSEMTIQGVEVIGEKVIHTAFLADRDGEEFTSEARGATPAEAAFQARWARVIENGKPPLAEFDAFVEAMSDFEVLSVEPAASTAPAP